MFSPSSLNIAAKKNPGASPALAYTFFSRDFAKTLALYNKKLVRESKKSAPQTPLLSSHAVSDGVIIERIKLLKKSALMKFSHGIELVKQEKFCEALDMFRMAGFDYQNADDSVMSLDTLMRQVICMAEIIKGGKDIRNGYLKKIPEVVENIVKWHSKLELPETFSYYTKYYHTLEELRGLLLWNRYLHSQAVIQQDQVVADKKLHPVDLKLQASAQENFIQGVIKLSDAKRSDECSLLAQAGVYFAKSCKLFDAAHNAVSKFQALLLMGRCCILMLKQNGGGDEVFIKALEIEELLEKMWNEIAGIKRGNYFYDFASFRSELFVELEIERQRQRLHKQQESPFLKDTMKLLEELPAPSESSAATVVAARV